MLSQTQQIIQQLIRPSCKSLSSYSIENLKLLIQEARAVMSVRQFEAHLDQWKLIGKKLNNNDKMIYLKQANCRTLLIALIRQEAMHIFSSSYLNRAKIDGQYIIYLKQLGPYFFIQAIMIVSKLKTIHKHFYLKMKAQNVQNHVSLKILRILQLCNQKKRSVNNNKSKFLCIVQDQTDRFQITKQLGKMLRQAWKKQKSKSTIRQEQEQAMKTEETPLKQMVKQPSLMFNNYSEQNDFSDQIFNLENTFRIYSTDSFNIQL